MLGDAAGSPAGVMERPSLWRSHQSTLCMAGGLLKAHTLPHPRTFQRFVSLRELLSISLCELFLTEILQIVYLEASSTPRSKHGCQRVLRNTSIVWPAQLTQCPSRDSLLLFSEILCPATRPHVPEQWRSRWHSCIQLSRRAMCYQLCWELGLCP